MTESESGHQHLRRQQESDLMQKARLLTDEKSVSFEMFLILLSSITLCSESQIAVFKEGRSNTLKVFLTRFRTPLSCCRSIHVNYNSGGFTVNQGFRLISLLVLGAED